MHELAYIFHDLHGFFLLFLIGGVTLPPLLLICLVWLVLTVVFISAVNAATKLSAFYPTFVAQAVLFLAVGFFASAKYQLLHAWVITIDLFQVMHVFTVLLFH